MNRCITLSLFFSIISTFASAANSSEFVSRAKRIQIIENSTLTAETQNMDELEKDMLILRAQKGSLEELKKQYPTLPTDKLQTLKKKVSEK